MSKDFIADHRYGLMASDFMNESEIENLKRVRLFSDFEDMDHAQWYAILENAKGLLAFLNAN